MRIFSRPPLMLLAALLLVLIAGVTLGVGFRYEGLQQVAQAKEDTQARLNQQLQRMSHVLRNALKQGDVSRVRQELSLITIDLNFLSFLVLSPSGHIDYANYLIWEGNNAGEMIAGYWPRLHQQALKHNEAIFSFDDSSDRLQSYFPVSGFDNGQGQFLLFVQYDIKPELKALQQGLKQRFYVLAMLAVLVIVLALVLLYMIVIRPLGSIASDGPIQGYATREFKLIQKKLHWYRQQRKQLQERLSDSEQRWLFAVDGSQNGIWDWNIATGQVYLSERWKGMLGYRPDELESDFEAWTTRVHPDDKERVLEELNQFIDGTIPEFENVHRLKHKDGHYVWVLDRAMQVSWDMRGNPTRIIGSHTDVSENIRNEEAIAFQANHDALTHLANRSAVMDTLEQHLQQADEHTRTAALFVLDLDNFKTINEALGHQAGDRLLVQVANRLSGYFANNALVARLGGDEFAVLAYGVGQDADTATNRALALGGGIRRLMSRPFMLDSQPMTISASVGICLVDSRPDSPEDLLKWADIAMYQAKQEGRNHCCVYNEAMEHNAMDSLWLHNELRYAIERNQFCLVFQPIMDARGEVVSAETLLRWYHPERGFISPAEFIPVAENSGVILDIGNWVLEEVCRFVVRMRSSGQDVPAIAVNVSARQFNQSGFAPQLFDLLERTQVDSSAMELEVTEYALLNNVDAISERMAALKEHGLHIAIDDFGTGYSSLSYLQSLPLSRLKVDASFVQKIGEDSASDAIVKAVVDMGHSLGLEVVAEGVETKEQLRYLQQLGCDYFQGYLFSKPLAEGDFITYIQRQRQLAV
ncbi:EAL domain-containing protein [Shewanella submarina]|uniref:Bifunctional diguanylate cyclase/phosphodiesterase n=1 Tax=Shewanella submarina TaxID=2016376 RepID=A0ABV7GJ90_9GAMM|nr:EAL domain-containing protein [Shewanella submarina]